MPYREGSPAPTLAPLLLRPRMNAALIGIAALFFFGPLYLQATLWSSVIAIRCTHVNAQPQDVSCEVRRRTWVADETHVVEQRGVSDVKVAGALGRGDAWLVLVSGPLLSPTTTDLTPRLNVAKEGMVASASTLRDWVDSETWREEVQTTYGSASGAIGVPLLGLVLCAVVAFLVTQRVRMRLLPGGRVVVDASKWLGPRVPFELPLDDVHCLSLDGPRLVLLTNRGPMLLARSVLAKRAERVIAEGNAWLEAARGWRDRAPS